MRSQWSDDTCQHAGHRMRGTSGRRDGWTRRLTVVAPLGAVLLLQAAAQAVGARSLEAQASVAPTPRAVADSFFAALARERWIDASAHLDMRSFAKFLADMVNSARAELPSPEMTVEERMAADSTLPRAVAEWQVAQMRVYASRRRFHDFSDQLTGITTFETLQKLTPEDGAARWLEANDPSTRLRRSLAARKCPSMIADSLKGKVLFERRTLGSLQVNDSTAYVLTTDDRDVTGIEMYREPPYAMLLVRRPGGWRIVPRMSLLQGSGMVYVDLQC